jgi:glyoxylase-like metal-dependent hydrolase (beta-lactamase superfamily II)
VQGLGFSPKDVRHIVVTHLDVDHAGGLADFPEATVHVLQAELDEAQRQGNFRSRHRYRARQLAGVKWQAYEATGEPWRGFPAVRQLRGLDSDLLMIPLPGHSAGSAGIVVDAGKKTFVHCGDAFFSARQLDVQRPSCPPGLTAFQLAMAHDERARRANLKRLRQLHAEGGNATILIASHDPDTFRSLSST